jgi:hypothetical protein
MIVPPLSNSFNALFGKTTLAFSLLFDCNITVDYEGSMKVAVFLGFVPRSSFKLAEYERKFSQRVYRRQNRQNANVEKKD